MTRKTKIATADTAGEDGKAPAGPSKLQTLIDLLTRPQGADLEEMMTATGWQAHSVRGAMAGALRKKGHDIQSQKSGNTRVWRITEKAQ
jgi:hypothetical protein